MSEEKVVIFNADDFGYSSGITRGIVAAHLRGVVTSTSCMVNTPATEEAVEASRENPRLAIGLHVNFTNEADRLVAFEDPALARTEVRRQFDRFLSLFGRLPTHIDSHQHVHRIDSCREAFLELAQETGLHLRDQSPVVYKGGFYGQWEFGVSEPDKVGVAFLLRMLREEFTAGTYELCCHPGYFDGAASFVYHRDRELELATLTDPAIRALLGELGLRLTGWRELPAVLRELGHAG